jgi:Domain of unknown function (DUF6438)
MLKYITFIIASSFLFFGCKTNKYSTKQDTVVITLQKTMCKGQCPVYKIEVYKSGLVKYEGKSNVDKIGKYQIIIDKSELDEIKKSFLEADFFDFEDEYTSKITDLPTTYLTFVHDNKTKQIRDYHGAPEKLKKLEKRIENLVASENWQKVE